MRRNFRILLLISFILLSGAIAMQFMTGSPPTSTLLEPLEGAVPKNISGWIERTIPLADTQEGLKTVEEILRYDEFISRSYTKGSIEVTLYIAYWKPDRIPPRMVGRHTPDRCWIQNGWVCDARARAVVLDGADGRRLQPAEMGTYSFPNRTTMYVAFWHLVGGRAYAYGPEQSEMVALAPLRDLWNFGLSQRHEQFFIRIASNQRFETFWTDPGFRKLLSALETLGVAQKT